MGMNVTSDEKLSSSSVPALPKNDTPVDISHMKNDEANSDDEQQDIEETDALLQSPVIQRSLSCPYPVGSPSECLGGDTNMLA